MILRRFLLCLALILLSVGARAQAPTCSSNYAPPFLTGGSMFGYLAPQWSAFFGGKADINGGSLCSPTISNPIFTGTPVFPGGPLGTMAHQNATAVAILGGTLANVSLTAATITSSAIVSKLRYWPAYSPQSLRRCHQGPTSTPGSPPLMYWLDAINQWIDPNQSYEDFYNQLWNIDTAVGYGLDDGGSGSPVPTFDFQEAMDRVGFGQGPFYDYASEDKEAMTLTYVFTFQLQPFEQAIVQSGVLPKPTGVLAQWSFVS